MRFPCNTAVLQAPNAPVLVQEHIYEHKECKCMDTKGEAASSIEKIHKIQFDHCLKNGIALQIQKEITCFDFYIQFTQFDMYFLNFHLHVTY